MGMAGHYSSYLFANSFNTYDTLCPDCSQPVYSVNKNCHRLFSHSHLTDANQEYAHSKSRTLASQHIEGQPLLLAEEIGGLIARFPFDITANTWLLNWIDRLICQHSLSSFMRPCLKWLTPYTLK